MSVVDVPVPEGRRLRLAVQLATYATAPGRVTPDLVDRLAAMGVEGVLCHFGLEDDGSWQDPRDADLDALARAAEVLRAGGIQPIASWGYWAALVARDDAARRDAELRMDAACDVAVALGCDVVITGSGSNSPVHGWYPHADNVGDVATGRLLESLARAAEGARERSVQIALKPHVLSTLHDVDALQTVLAGLPAHDIIACFDPVNLVTPRHAFGAAELMRDYLAASAGRVAYAHLKDYLLSPDTIITMPEVAPGLGLLDLDDFLRLSAAHARGGWVALEHVAADDLPASVARVRSAADALTGAAA